MARRFNRSIVEECMKNGVDVIGSGGISMGDLRRYGIPFMEEDIESCIDQDHTTCNPEKVMALNKEAQEIFLEYVREDTPEEEEDLMTAEFSIRGEAAFATLLKYLSLTHAAATLFCTYFTPRWTQNLGGGALKSAEYIAKLMGHIDDAENLAGEMYAKGASEGTIENAIETALMGLLKEMGLDATVTSLSGDDIPDNLKCVIEKLKESFLGDDGDEEEGDNTYDGDEYRIIR